MSIAPTIPERLGRSESTALRIYAPMKLKESQPLWITSPHPIRVNGVWLVAESPVQLLSLGDTTIYSLEPLTAAFSEGWNKCPNEVKLKILSANLVEDMPTTNLPNNILLQHLRMTPEVANLSIETFYKKNSFLIDLTTPYIHSVNTLQHFCLRPPPTFAHLIQKIEIHLSPASGCWQRLQRIAEGHYGLSKLQHIKVLLVSVLMMEDHWRAFTAATGDIVVRFKCQGMVEVARTGTDGRSLAGMSIVDNDTVLQYMQSKIQFLQ